MKQVQRTTLIYQEGASDKVYEVDLCELRPDAYVVNFRYGRRGGTLKEGTKTTGAVPLAEARKVFDALVAEKRRKGYTDAGAQPAAPAAAKAPARQAARAADGDARKQAVLKRLAAGDGAKGWPLERAIWRAGELRIREAVPDLIALIGTKPTVRKLRPIRYSREPAGTSQAPRDYCIAWALGRCGDPQAIDALARLYNDDRQTDAVRRIAREALLMLSDAATRAEFLRDAIQLPEGLRSLAAGGPATDFAAALRGYLQAGTVQAAAVLERLQVLDSEMTRPALLNELRTLPLAAPYFQRLRRVFKVAEYRQDAEIFGLIAYRFEKERARFDNEGYFYYLHPPGGGYINRKDLPSRLKDPEGSLAYGSKTRNYLRRRVCRTLRRLGELGEAEAYVKMAVGVLLNYNDTDAVPPRESTYIFWRGRQKQTRTNRWDTYAPYWPLNQLLYANSQRYALVGHTTSWRCKGGYKPGDPEPHGREEAFPKLWDQVPAGLVHLLAESNCRPVHHFAARALAGRRDVWAELDLDTVILLLERPYEVTAGLGFEIAKERYQAAAPDRRLVLALAQCAYPPGREQAQRWIDEGRHLFLADTDLLVALATSSHEDTRAFAGRFLKSATLRDDAAQLLIGRLLAWALAQPPEQAPALADVSATLTGVFGRHLRTIGMAVVLDLLHHPVEQVQELGGTILLNHETRPADLPEGILQSLINSPFASLRGIGVRLFDQLPDETVLLRLPVLVGLATHALPDLRNASRPLIRRLAAADPVFAARITAALLDVLLGAEPGPGVHAHLARLLQEDLAAALAAQDLDTATRLVAAAAAPAQELGGVLLQSHPQWADRMDVFDIVQLASNEIRSVREAAWTLFKHALPRMRHEPADLAKGVKLLDAQWEDSRRFGFETFSGDFFSAAELTPQVVLTICDSVLPDVQRFGRDLVVRFFRQEQGLEYMLRLSEHPTAEMQLFVTNLVTDHAAGSPERLQQLAFFFTSVLSRVNRGRAAKDRVLGFLAREAAGSEAAAAVVAQILSRQAVTIAIGDRARAVETLLQIHRDFPGLPLPIAVKPPEVRHAV